jgi:hypothetical protein
MAVWKCKEEDKALEKGGIERGRQEVEKERTSMREGRVCC